MLRSPREDVASSSSPASFVPALARAWENPQPCGPSQEPWEFCRADKRCLVSGYILLTPCWDISRRILPILVLWVWVCCQFGSLARGMR